MATAAQVIKAALQKIIVQASEADLEGDEFADAVFTLNNMMLGFDADGIHLGFTEITDLGDVVTVPTGALRGVIYNLAQDLAPEYDGQFTGVAIKIAADGLKIMEKLGVAIPTSSFGSTLPRGSGNEGSQGHHISHFFPESEEAILSETTGCIAVETGTAEAIA